MTYVGAACICIYVLIFRGCFLMMGMEMRMKEVLIVEEKEETRRELAKLVKEVKPDSVVYEAADENEAYVIAIKRSIDLFIADIILHSKKAGGDHSGTDFLINIRSIEKYSFAPIIILSSLYDYKMCMFSIVHCYQFIEKPYDADKVKAVIKSAIRYNTRDNNRRYIYFHSKGLLEAVALDEILYIESKNHKMMVYTINETFTIPYKTCNKMLEEIDSDDFAMCNRGTIVNIEHIKSIDKVNRYIYMKYTDAILDIGSVLKKQFLEELKNRGKIL